jgi:hypothetical protein
MECGKNALPDAFDDLVTTVDFTPVVQTLLFIHSKSELYNFENRKRFPYKDQGLSAETTTSASWM